MDSFELFDRFRSDVVDVEGPPHLWTDEEIFGYMDAAEKMFWRLVGGIADASNPKVCEISLVPNDPFSPLHPAILTVRQARLRSSNRELSLMNLVGSDLRYGPMDDDYGMPVPFAMSDEIGPVTSMILGVEEDKVRWHKIPAGEDTALLVVYRLPLVTIVDGTEAQKLDLPERHHLYLLDWMKHLAYRKADAETFDRTKAKECSERFQEYCSLVKREIDRKKNVPRQMAYGGI